jgi:hypothetical protein
MEPAPKVHLHQRAGISRRHAARVGGSRRLFSPLVRECIGGAKRPPAGLYGAWLEGGPLAVPTNAGFRVLSQPPADKASLLPARRNGVEVRVSAGHGRSGV